MKKRKVIIVLTVILLLLVICTALLIAARPVLERIEREKAQEKLMNEILSGSTVTTLKNVPIVQGAEDEFGITEEPSILDRRPTIEVTGYAVIEIPVIDLEMPVVKGTDAESLRASAGWYTESAEIGTAGNTVILGHRMYGYGEHFNRLDEVKSGDEIVLTTGDHNRYLYTVTGTEVITPGVIMDKLAEHNEGFSLTLVTCTPTGVGSHRLLVYAQLTDSTDK